MAKDDPHPQPKTVVIERDGERHTGSYVVEGGDITVSYQGRHTQPTLLGETPARSVAKVLLAELMSEDLE